ncbi:MAG: class F sortase [Acidimicrobiia bacterium]|nr:class F sortase [Acidimicrobiia bacterium]
MRSAIAAFAVGFLLLGISLGFWALSKPSAEAGDSAAVEQALITPATEPISRTTTTTTISSVPNSTQPEQTDSQPTVPQFTIGLHPEGHNRVPVTLRIPAIGVEAPVKPAGVEADGEMEVPGNVTEVGWYKYGSAPGESGSAVLAAHVDLAGSGPGVFFDLRLVEPGDIILVDLDDDTTLTYRAEARTVYDKDDLPTEAIFSRQGPPILTLVTCGGGFNRSLRSYDSNVVVYAVPLDDAPPVSLKDRL